MAIIKEKGLLIKVVGIVLLCGGIVFANYIEGTDTTDVNGYGLDSAFRVQNGNIGRGNALYIVYYCLSGGFVPYGGESGLFNYSFDDIKTAAVSNYYLTPSGFHCFVVKKRDSTYSKVQILSQFAGNRYIFKYGTNTTPNNRMLDSSSYDQSIRYKPNNASNYYRYPGDSGGGFNGMDTLSWEPPLPNNNHLLGYIFYMSKRNAVIDTTAPINPAQWDSIGFTTSTSLNISCCYRDFSFFNLVAVYIEGKSDFLQGWTYQATTAVGVMQTQLPINLSNNRIEIKKAPGGYFISLPQLRENAVASSLAVFNATGEKVAQFSVVKGNGVLWKTDNLAEGTYLIRAELPDKSVLTRTVMFSK